MPLQLLDDNVDPNVTAVTLFDTTTLDPNQVWQVTVLMWPSYTPAFAGTLPSFVISLETAGEAPVELVHLTVAQAAALSTSILAGTPPAILDGFTLRGQQKLVLRATAFEANTNGSWGVFGYFEMNGEDPLPYDFRPLEPTALVAPFNALPAKIDVAAAGTVPAFTTAHLLSATYVDLVTLTAGVQGLAAGAGDTSLAMLKFPNGVQLFLLRASPTGEGVARTFILDGIPLLAPSATNNALQIGFITADTLVAMRATAYGSFTRIS